jgi:hypothetical protein
VDAVEPLRFCVDAAEDVRDIEFEGEDKGLNVVYVRGFVGWVGGKWRGGDDEGVGGENL